ncbi:site-specific integrase [Acrocarpospora macrocephala]|uniref:Site-specific integrase n=1 Tax=Acrocarpospora macrocephala TaxID=150177 RepID=A0A5M3WL41_9ACTN|nr:site-specific integrase [Acrocarpospora macrocephala]GES07941.1 site-specific integrase [Acrocarpospora macrocephala]
MTKRRSRGDGGLHWDEKRQRWIASVTVGYTPAGKRIVKKASGETKTEANTKLKKIIRDYEDGLAVESSGYTVADAVRYWLQHGLKGRGSNTVALYTEFAENHVISALGARKLRDLSVEDVDRWLAGKAQGLSTRTLKMIHGILNRSVKNAMIRDKVKRNVVDLCEVPEGRAGRKSKALTLAQAVAVMAAADRANVRMRCYVVLSLLTGARTEELRELNWSHLVAFDDTRKEWVSVEEAGWDHTEYAIYVWRSVRRSGDTKTVKSRRTLKLPQKCVEALQQLWEDDGQKPADVGSRLVFCTKNGTALSAGNVRRDFRRVLKDAGLIDKDWTPREMRHSFVSLLSASGVPIEHISRLVGHANTVVTETVYRLQIRPVMQEGAMAMDDLFGDEREA